MKIDFHNHFYPKKYLRELEKRQVNVNLTTDRVGRQLLVYKGDYNVIVASHWNAEERIKDMNRFGIDMQVLTFTAPGVHVEKPEHGVALARVVNDELAKVVETYPERFVALATLPLQDVDRTLEELDRAISGLGLMGVMIFSNINGKPLDSTEFWSIYEKAAKLDIPIFIHPTTPVAVETMDIYRLPAIIGFPFDTSLAITRLVFSGVLEKYPRLKFVLAHLGGAVPYLIERMDRGYRAYPECKTISKPPANISKKYIWTRYPSTNQH